LSSSG